MDPLFGKRLVILGMARQGTALARFAVEAGATVTVTDLRSAKALQGTLEALADLPSDRLRYVLGEHPFSLLDDCDLLALSGGVATDSPLVIEARRRGIPLTNDSIEFMRRTPAPVIGITGSAGKTTTTALVGQMGHKSDRQTWIGGNIGRPLIADLHLMSAADLVVQELSSFQLELWDQCSPPVAAILNITPNHLDRHKSMAQYIEAKGNILRFQKPGDIAVLSADDPGSLEMSQMVRGRLRLFSARQEVADGAFIRNEHIWLSDRAGARAGSHYNRLIAGCSSIAFTVATPPCPAHLFRSKSRPRFRSASSACTNWPTISGTAGTVPRERCSRAFIPRCGTRRATGQNRS